MFNLTTKQRIKRSQAYRRVEQCISRWVVEGFQIEDLGLPEMVKARSEQARLAEPLALAECHGLKFVHPDAGIGRRLALDAVAFAAGYYHPVSA